MQPVPRILVGTLSCGEGELDDCVAAIRSQREVDIEHYVLKDKPEPDAHQSLFSCWNQRRAEFDLFVKVDADTILNRNTALVEIWRLLKSDDEITGLQIGLLDYFTDGIIAGLNCFSPRVTFSAVTDALYCDRVIEGGHRRVLKLGETAALAPIGWHCRRPHVKQAFHFGFRRMMKGQTEVVRAMIDAWREKGGEGRLWALCGARAAFFCPLTDASYSNPEFSAEIAAALAALQSGRLSGGAVVCDVEHILDGRFGIRARRIATRVLGAVRAAGG